MATKVAVNRWCGCMLCVADVSAGVELNESRVTRTSGHVVGVGRDASPQLLVGPLHVGVMLLDVLPGEPHEFLVVRAFQTVTAGTIDRTHV